MRLFAFATSLMIGFSANANFKIAGQSYSKTELQARLESPQCKDFIDYLEGKPTAGPNDEAEERFLKAHTFSAIVQDKDGKILLNLTPNGEPDDIYKLYSISKTTTALAFGRLIELAKTGAIKGKNAQGKFAPLELDSRLIDFLPRDQYPEAYDLIANKMTESPTAEHLLSMAAGIPWCEYVSCSSRDTLKMNYGRRDDVVTAYVENLNTLPEGELATPGVGYNYSAGNAVLLHQMMRTYLGGGYESFFKEHFFGPLGIENYRFEVDGTGLYLGGSSLYLSGIDTSKIAMLLLSEGQVAGYEQFIAPSFVALLKSPNAYAESEQTPAEINIWEGPVGSSLWLNRRLPGLSQFMPRVPESMYYSAGFYGQRLIVFPEHKTAEEQNYDGEGLGLTLTRLGAEPPLGPNSYSNHWNVTVEKFYQCFSGGKPVLEVPDYRRNLPSACRSPQLTTLEEEVDFTKEFALNLYPYQIQAIEQCNCVYVQEHLKLKSSSFLGRRTITADEEKTFAICDKIYPVEWPDGVLPLIRPTRRSIDHKNQTVSVSGNPFQNHAGIDLGGGLTNKVATAKYNPATKSCEFVSKPTFGFIGRTIVGPQAESAAETSFLETQEKMQARLEEIRERMREEGIEGEPIQDGCFE